MEEDVSKSHLAQYPDSGTRQKWMPEEEYKLQTSDVLWSEVPLYSGLQQSGSKISFANGGLFKI